MNIYEIMECSNKPAEFIPRLQLQHPRLGLIPFRMTNDQNNWLTRIHAAVLENKGLVQIAAGRQVGISSLAAAYAFWMAQFRANSHIRLGFADIQNGSGAIDRVRFCHTRLALEHPEVVPAVTNQKTKIGFSNGSTVHSFVTGSVGSLRGHALNLVILDNAKFNDELETYVKYMQHSCPIVSIVTR
jgi:hypothetical protein